jgi:predicted RecB family nuclease
MEAGGIPNMVPLQGSYVARRCPVVVQLEFDESLDVEEAPLTEAEQARVDGGRTFEREVFQALLRHQGDRVALIEPAPKADQQMATAAALQSDASIVLGGWLPDDHVALRTGRPDVLIRVDEGWAPVDVKHHSIVSASAGGSELRSELSDPRPEASVEMEGLEPTSHALKDALQLAHYRRLLEAAGLASEQSWGGIIGVDGGVWWCDLAEPRWRKGTRSALEIYDQEFDLRLRVIARQLERNSDPTKAPLVIPLRKGECTGCSWRHVCGDRLLKGDSVSLVGGVTWSGALRLTRQGIATRSDLAGLDWSTAAVALGESATAAKVDLHEVLAICGGLPPATELRDALGRRKRTRLRRLESKGMTTVGDLGALDARTSEIASLRIGHLPSLIDQARAATAGVPFLRRGAELVDVPRADVEVDVDMENSESGVYLWGVRVSRSVRSETVPGYLPFVRWDPLDDGIEADVFAGFWTWMIDLRDATTADGRTFAAYCYSSAENTQMLRIAVRAVTGPTVDEVRQFIASPQWVDLHTVVKSRLITGGGLGLKKVAPLAGFEWRDDDPGGDQSTVWYDRAVNHPDPAVREENRARLLAYNEDDVVATAVIRDWLSTTVFPSIVDAVPPTPPIQVAARTGP